MNATRSCSAVCVVAFGLLLLACAGPARNQGTVGGSNSDSAPTVTITADALHADYAANEVAADTKYKGKTLEVSGLVKEIGKDAFGSEYVDLKLSSNQFLTSVRCFFGQENQAALASLVKGQQAAIRGKGNGFVLKTVQLKDCTIRP